MKRFTFSATPITELEKHFDLKTISFATKARAGFNTIATRPVYQKDNMSTVEYLYHIILDIIADRGATPITINCESTDNKSQFQSSFLLLATFSKKKIAALDKSIAIYWVNQVKAGDAYATRIAESITNFSQIRQAVELNEPTLTESLNSK